MPRGRGEDGAAAAPEQLRAPPRGLLPAAAAPRLLPDARRREPGAGSRGRVAAAAAGTLGPGERRRPHGAPGGRRPGR